MAKTIPTEFKETKNLQENRPIHLFTIYDYDGSNTDLYFAENNADVVFDGTTYTAFPISFDVVSENKSGNIDRVQIILANISRVIGGYLETYDFRKKKISIKLVWADQLDDTDNYIEDIFYIDGYTADEKNVTFSLSSKFDVLDVSLPFRKYSRNYCCWVFKGSECGYTGSETTCNKTKAQCKSYNNYSRFGGFPSVTQNRVVLG